MNDDWDGGGLVQRQKEWQEETIVRINTSHNL